jgi:peptide/nickel transport system permease protein
MTSTTFQHTRYVISENLVTFGAFALFLVLVFCLPFLARRSPPMIPSPVTQLPLYSRLLRAHWFGTDQLGRDVLSRVIVATQVGLGHCGVGGGPVVFSRVAAGHLCGLLWRLERSHYFPLHRYADGLSPVCAGHGPGGGPGQHRRQHHLRHRHHQPAPLHPRHSLRGLVRREAGFVEAARLTGNSEWRIMARHLFPNVLPVMMVHISLNMGWAILNAAGLSFIGLGVQPPTPNGASWSPKARPTSCQGNGGWPCFPVPC